MMKKGIIFAILACSLLLSIFFVMNIMTVTTEASEFTDVNDIDWYYPYVQYVVEAGLMTGFDGAFFPNEVCHRGTMATAFAQLEGEKVAVAEEFGDVVDTPYALGISWCLEHDIMKPYGEAFFGTYEGVTREEFCSSFYYLGQYYQLEQEVTLGVLDEFSDSDQILPSAEEAMSWMVSMGLMSGYQGKLDPKGPVTRSEMAVMLTLFDHMRQGTTFESKINSREMEVSEGATPYSEMILLYDTPSFDKRLAVAMEKDLTVVAYGQDNWVLVDYQDSLYYVLGLEYSEDLPIFYEETAFVADYAKVYAQPSGNSAVVDEISQATFVSLVAKKDGWFLLRTGGYVNWADVERELSDYRMKEAEAAVVFPTELATGAELGKQIASYALHFLDYPYAYGEQSLNGFTCAGFADYIYGCFGMDIGSTPYEMNLGGVAIEKSEIQPGDLLFFGSLSHVGIYIGNNKIVHSATPPDRVIISDLSETYYSTYYHSARRFYE